jgi:hypothetical protein
MAIDSPVEYGRRLMPQILDHLASSDPNRIVYSIAAFSDDCHEFRHISAHAFAKAIDKTAWWLHDRIGAQHDLQNEQQDASQNGQVQERPRIRPLGYIGPRKLKFSEKVVLRLNFSMQTISAMFC